MNTKKMEYYGTNGTTFTATAYLDLVAVFEDVGMFYVPGEAL